MPRPRSPISRHLPAVLIALMASTTIATGQAASEERNRPPVVTLVQRGEGIPVLLRWRPGQRVDRTIVVSSQTGTTTTERPALDAEEDARVQRGFIKPPIQKIWTVSGRMTQREDEGSVAQWRVIDGAARVIGVEGLARARGTETGDAESAAETGKDEIESESTPPASPTNTTTPDFRDPRSASKRRTGDRVGTPDPAAQAEAMERMMKLEQITDEAVGRTGGAAIYQNLAEGGLDPTSLRVRLPKTDRRAEYELQGLLEAMRLAEVQLPSQPVAPGASWKTSWSSLFAGIAVTTEVTWRLVSTDEAAKATNLAETATIRMEFRRRLRDPGENPSARERRVEADGRGEVVVTLGEPLLLSGRMVEQPILAPAAGGRREVTRYRITPSP
ncbi:MAG: hypothetical protein GY895_21875 [Phycisphaera sp.]|nr:hypothetical protein [Phycisphaera sp.]